MYKDSPVNRKKSDAILQRARLTSLHTVERFITQETHQDSIQPVSLSRKRTQKLQQQEREEFLSGVIRRCKTKLYVKQFVKKINQSIVRTNPPQFTQFRKAKKRKSIEEESLSGIYIRPKLQLLVGLMYVLSVLIFYFLSTFQGFLLMFREQEAHLASVRVTKIVGSVLISIYFLSILVIKVNHKGRTLNSLYSITKHNLASLKFYVVLLTLAASILFIIFVNQAMGIVMFFVSLLNAPLLGQVKNEFKLIYAGNFYIKQYSRLIGLFLLNILFAHLVATILLAINLINSAEVGWISNAGLLEQGWFIIYIWSFYWAATIMMTVGFGDFSATTWQEAIVIAFVEVFAVMVLAYIISETMNIINDIREFSKIVEEDVGVFRRMIDQNNISIELQYQIISYIRQSTQIKRNYQFDEQKDLLEKLPHGLKTAYLSEANQEIFMKIPFFRYLSRTKTLITLANSVEGKVFYPTQIINERNQQVYTIKILRNGQIGFAFRKTNSKYNGIILQKMSTNYKSNPVLLNIDLFDYRKAINFDIVSQDYAFCYLLPFPDFIAALGEFQMDYEHYFTLLHKHRIFEDEFSFGILCEYCESHKVKSHQKGTDHHCQGSIHTVFDCPKLHFMPYKQRVVLRFLTLTSKNKPVSRDVNFKRGGKTIINNFLYPLKLWNYIFKELTANWGIKRNSGVFFKRTQSKLMFSRVSLQNQSRNEGDENDSIISDIDQSYHNPHNVENLVRKGVELALQQHCCEEGLWPENDHNGFNVDCPEDYTGYFLLANPSRLIQFPLSPEKRKKHTVVRFLH